MLDEMLGSHLIRVKVENMTEKLTSKWNEILGLWQKNETNCSPDFFKLVAERESSFWTEELVKNMRTASKRWENICYSRLEDKIQSELEAMSETTRKQFKLFVEQEQRECISKGKPRCSKYRLQSSLVYALRRLVSSVLEGDGVDQSEAAKRFVSACKEMAASDSIKTTRAQHHKSTPLLSQPYFPHVRFYDFCRRLLDLPWSEESIDYHVRVAPTCVKRFFVKLDEIRARRLSRAGLEVRSSETAESEEEQKRLVAEAAVRSDKWPVIKFVSDSLEHRLDDLKKKCSRLLGQVDNLIWMHQHMYEPMGPERDGLQAPDTERNLGNLDACKQLIRLKNDEIIEMTKNSRDSFAPVKRCFGCSST
jgi:hypothetical protein